MMMMVMVLIIFNILAWILNWPVSLIDSHVVNQELLREVSLAVGVTRPVASNCQVKNYEVVLIEGPVTAWLTLVNAVVHLAIEEEVNVLWLPVNSIGMEIIIEAITAVIVMGGVITRSMERSMNIVRILTNPFQNINLTASWPSNLADVVS